MERMKEQIAEIFAMLEAELATANREYEEIDSRYKEIAAAKGRAYCKLKTAEEAFGLIDTLQGLIEYGEETSE